MADIERMTEFYHVTLSHEGSIQLDLGFDFDWVDSSHQQYA